MYCLLHPASGAPCYSLKGASLLQPTSGAFLLQPVDNVVKVVGVIQHLPATANLPVGRHATAYQPVGTACYSLPVGMQKRVT